MSTASFLALCLVPLPLAFMAACGSDARVPPAPGTIESTSSSIINGTLDSTDTYPSVVSLKILVDPSTRRGAGCTGTLIAPDVVVTARHCVSEQSEKGVFGDDYDAANIYVFLGPTPGGAPATRGSKIVHPDDTSLENNDFALLVLQKRVGRSVSPVRLSKPPVRSQVVTAVGYGLTTSDGARPESYHKRYARTDLKVLAVGPLPDYRLGGKEFFLGESICSGDSGGPIFDQATGALMGISSRGGNGSRPTATSPWAACVGTKAINYLTRVDGFAALIRSTLADLGEKPVDDDTPVPPPPTLGALGATCKSPNDCTSKLCVAWGGKQLCSQACTPTKACPASYACIEGYCLPGGAPPVDPPVDPPADPPPADPAPSAKPPAAKPSASATPTNDQSSSGGTFGCSTGARHGGGGGERSTLGFVGLAALVAVASRRRRRGA